MYIYINCIKEKAREAGRGFRMMGNLVEEKQWEGEDSSIVWLDGRYC